MKAIAIDSGGTKIVGAVVCENGEILEKIRYENTGQSGDFFVNTYRTIIKQYLEKHDVLAVGIGCNGRLDNERGVVLECSAHYPNWIGRPIKAELENEFHIPIHMENDCRAAVQGEMWVGAAKGYSDILGIIVGTGVGGCYIHKGEMVKGWRNIAGEIGHGILYPEGRPCACGQKGCAERYISGTALWQSYNERRNEQAIRSGYEFFDLIRLGDTLAVEVMNQFIIDFAALLTTSASFYDPEVILLGGGIVDSREYWWDSLQRRYLCRFMSESEYVPIVVAKRGNDAALLGAANLVFTSAKLCTGFEIP